MRALAPILGSEKFRFLVAGATTTAFSYLLYLLLLLWIAPTPAYAISYVAGIVWAYSINSTWVFKGRWTWSGLAAYPLVYLVQAVVSFALFSLLLRQFRLPAAVAPLVTIVLMLPINYALGRKIVRRTSHPTPSDNDRLP